MGVHPLLQSEDALEAVVLGVHVSGSTVMASIFEVGSSSGACWAGALDTRPVHWVHFSQALCYTLPRCASLPMILVVREGILGASH
jgi:hypothetical protein